MKYYRVVAKCGHVGGPGKYILIPYYTVAESGKAAAAGIRFAPRVKHDHKDAIREVREISYEEYLEGRIAFDLDPYNCCHSPQQQREYWDQIAPRVQEEQVALSYEYKVCRLNDKRAQRYGYKYCGKSDRGYRKACG